MIETVHLAPHDPMPSGPGRQVVVLRRFGEDDPDRTTIQIVLTGSPEQSTHPHRPDGTPMDLFEAIAAAGKVAEEEGVDRVFVLDRIGGERERAIPGRSGDHTIGMDRLSDTDEEDGEQGADMRDVAHPTRT